MRLLCKNRRKNNPRIWPILFLSARLVRNEFLIFKPRASFIHYCYALTFSSFFLFLSRTNAIKQSQKFHTRLLLNIIITQFHAQSQRARTAYRTNRVGSVVARKIATTTATRIEKRTKSQKC